MKYKDYGTLAKGETFQLNFSSIVGYAGSVLTSLAGINFEFTVKASRDDLDAAAVATVVDGDTELEVSAGTLKVQLVTETISETLTAGAEYFFDGWMKESGQPARVFELGSYIDPKTGLTVVQTIGKFRVIQPINRTKNLT